MIVKPSPLCGPEFNIKSPRAVMPLRLYLFAFHGDTEKSEESVHGRRCIVFECKQSGISGALQKFSEFTPCLVSRSVVSRCPLGVAHGG